MPDFSEPKIWAQKFVEGSISLSDLSDWLALNYWGQNVPDTVNEINLLVAECESGLINEIRVRDELASSVGGSKFAHRVLATKSTGAVAKLNVGPSWIGNHAVKPLLGNGAQHGVPA